MSRSVVFIFSRYRFKGLLGAFLSVLTSLGLFTTIIIFIYISEFLNHSRQVHHHYLVDARIKASSASAITVSGEQYLNLSSTTYLPDEVRSFRGLPAEDDVHLSDAYGVSDGHGGAAFDELDKVQDDDVFHDRELFLEDYKAMNKTLKIFIYPHKRTDPFANVLSPPKTEPGGNYASESYFKKSLFNSHFITKNPSKADLFYLPFSITGLRNDKRVGVGGIKNFVKDYISDISHQYPYWNRSNGADHFYVACHSVGRTAMEKAEEVKLNAIQVVCSSSYFLPGYISHKDVSIPQIWPRNEELVTRSPLERKRLAFYAGAMNSRERKSLVEQWEYDSDLSVHRTRLQTPYSEALLGSKFCIHAKGYEVNTARIGDAIYYGCVPVILADHYDLPFGDIFNWKKFSVVVSSMDIPLLKKILQEEISYEEYLRLQSNVLSVQKHFRWHGVPVDFDAFHIVMYELWIRRGSLRISNG